MAAVPMIVHPRFVETYTYFGNNTLYLTPTADKGEMEVMLKVLRSDISELNKVSGGGDCGDVCGGGMGVWVRWEGGRAGVGRVLLSLLASVSSLWEGGLC